MARLVLLVYLLTQIGCKASIDVGASDESSNTNFKGCSAATAVDTQSVRVQFDFPSEAQQINVYRDGGLVTSSSSPSISSYIDQGLREGETYTYTCEAIVKGQSKTGADAVTVTTMAFNAPTFSGIFSASATSPNSANLTWAPPATNGSAAAYYQIYATMGGAVAWTTVRTTVSSGLSLSLSNLGDEIPYAFGVRACTFNDICDSNVTQKSLTLPDGGAPQTTGAVTAEIIDSKIRLSVPWVESNGGILNRKVYQRQGPVGGSNLANYTLVLTQLVSDITDPGQSIDILGVSENTTYHYIVQDIDPSSNNNGNLNFVSVGTGDLTKPSFSGISSLANGTNVETELDAGFTAINRQNSNELDTNGASHYLVYLTSALFPSSPSDPCLETSPYLQVTSDAFAPGPQTLTLTSLNPRSTYRVCIKARDNAGNISTNTENLSRTTLDTTDPGFDGIQTIAFDTVNNEVDITWNSSSSADIKEYKVHLWRNTTTPTAPQITTITVSHATNSSGYSFDSIDYAYVDGDDVYAVVDACDDANILPGGTQNCTSFAVPTFKTVEIPDTVAPAGFAGIRPAIDLLTPAQGQVTIKWFEPTWTPDYWGFKVYTVNPDDSINFIADCPCATPGACITADTECSLAGLDAYRTYEFHVKAYDEAGNLTNYLDPATNFSAKRTTDTTAPTFTSGLSLGPAPTFTLTWAAATDNQYPLEPGAVVNYEVWAKTGTTFATPTNPSADGSLKTTTTSLSYSDAGLVEGIHHYYTTCAVDASGNKTCDGVIRDFLVPDITPPVIGSFTTTHNKYLKRWDLNWAMSDNISATGNLQVTVYQKNSDSQENAGLADSVAYANTGTTTAANLIGPLNESKWVNYMLRVQDETGNSTTAHLSVESDNVITLTDIRRTSGPTAGGQFIVITGTGFSYAVENGFGTDPVVLVDTNPCTDLHHVSDTKIVCETPAHAAGFVNVSVTNPEGSSDLMTNAYEYSDTTGHLCDNPGTWDTDFADGTGTIVDPYIICNYAHFDMIRNNLGENGALDNYRTGSKYFKMADSVDLSGGHAYFSPTFNLDGDGYALVNLNEDRGGAQCAGLFFSVGTGSLIENFVLSNAATFNCSNGGLITHNGGAFTADNLFIQGSVTGTSNQVSGFGGEINGSDALMIKNTYVNVDVSGGLSPAGVLSRFRGTMDNVFYFGTVTSTGGRSASFASTVESAGSVIKNSGARATINNGTAGAVYWTQNGGIYDNIHFEGTITKTGGQVGGLFGNLDSGAIVRNSSAKGNFTSTSVEVGGIAGLMTDGTIQDTHYLGGTLTGTGEIGGVIGDSREGTILRSSATGTIDGVTGSASNIGGLAGVLFSTGPLVIQESYSTATVQGHLATGSNFGGLVGRIIGGGGTRTIVDSYATGSVQGFATVGGLIGYADPQGQNMIIERNYATGLVVGSSNLGGFAGLCNNCDAGLQTITDNFWDTVTTGQATGFNNSGTGGLSSGITGQTTTQMQDQVLDIYGNSTWDFLTPVWKWTAGSGVYPSLDWEP